MKWIWLIGLCLPIIVTQGQSNIRDLKSDWQYFDGKSYQPVTGSTPSTIHFELVPAKHQDDTLVIRSFDPVSVYIDHKIIATDTRVELTIEKISRLGSGKPVLVSIFQRNPENNGLQTYLKMKPEPVDKALLKRPAQFFIDFSVIAMLLITSLFITIIRLHPKLANDYYAISRIFAMRDKEDTQLLMRIGNSTNVLIYVLTALLLAYFFIVIIYKAPEEIALAAVYKLDSFWGMMWRWALLTLLILGIFLVKIIIVYAMSLVFGFRQSAGVQYFNWIRIQLVSLTGIALILFTYTVILGNSQTMFSFLYQLIGWLMGFWIILFFIKMTFRNEHSAFHLFSYICATEVIPFMILVHVCYF